MEESKRSCGVLVNNPRIHVRIVIIHVLLSIVNYPILQAIPNSQKYRQPLVVGDKLVLGYVDLASFLVQSFVVPVGVYGGESVG